jgi:hypothetical protein
MSAPSCRDCKHVVSIGFFRYVACNFPFAGYSMCSNERTLAGNCGPQAKFFEPRFWVRVRNLFKRKEERK